MKRVTFLLLLAGFVKLSYGQAPDWSHASNWTIYQLQGNKPWRLTADSLKQYPRKELNTDSMSAFVAGSSLLSTTIRPAWMGVHVVTCDLEGKTRMLEISTYAGFFYDVSARQYYQVEKREQTAWLNYLADKEASFAN